MFEFDDDEEVDLNAYKTAIILSLYDFLTFFEGDTHQFRDMIYKILCIDNYEELMFLELDLCNDDVVLEKILNKLRINRMVVKETENNET